MSAMAHPLPRHRQADQELATATLRLERAKAQLGNVPAREHDGDQLSPEGVAARMAVLAAELDAIRARNDDES